MILSYQKTSARSIPPKFTSKKGESPVKSVVDVTESIETSDAIAQLTREISTLQAQLSDVLNKFAVHLPFEEKYELINQQLRELESEIAKIKSALSQYTASTNAQDTKMGYFEKLLHSTRSEIEELRKQHTTLLSLFVKAEKAKHNKPTSQRHEKTEIS